MHRIVFVLFLFLFSFCGDNEIQNNDVSSTSPSSTTTSIAETTSTTKPKETVTTVKNIKTVSLKLTVWDDTVNESYGWFIFNNLSCIDPELEGTVLYERCRYRETVTSDDYSRWYPGYAFTQGSDFTYLKPLQVGEIGYFNIQWGFGKEIDEKNQITICYSPTNEDKGDLATIWVVLNDENIEIDGFSVRDVVIDRATKKIELLDDNSYPDCYRTEESTTTTVADTTTTTVADTTTTTVADTTTTTTVFAVDYPQLTISEISSSIPEYDRDDWNHWIDENGDCQNTRHEVLIEESFETVTYTSDTYCSVNTGKWFGSYTGQYYYNASELDIDHFIPLKNAHQSGGYDWSSAKKEEYANYRLDPDNLISVNLSANRSKGAKGPDEWKPSNTEYWCEYAYDWIRIKHYWNLTATQAEWDALVSMIETCPTGFAYADAEEEPVVELPTPTTTTTTTSTTTTIASSQPDNPGNTKNCGDFSNYSEAKTWFDTYYPYYGDVGDLDRDGDLIPCESLPGAP